MFSFHKPKIYRSNLGCCICKAKSSSSRFTDSQKYENEFERCFRIQEKRSGEICNACVLLVKRWKKLSPEGKLNKHWHHVVDARAGPGTKLTGGRRLTGNACSGGGSSSSLSISPANSGGHQEGGETTFGSRQQQQQQRFSAALPLSSSQANNQPAGSSSSTGRRRVCSFSKARAIDTNVSTFTFGEPPNSRRSYMTTEPSYASASSSMGASASSALCKPQSALNSSAFESVIKRFRQRQQQQQLEAERRQLSRQQRLSKQQQQQDASSTPRASSGKAKQVAVGQSAPTAQRNLSSAPTSNKRVKRSSESFGSLSVDGLRVSSLLDSSMWRKEKLCCGVIFRGLHNEVAIFPKLLKPCECRLNKLNKRTPPQDDQVERDFMEGDEEEEEEEEEEEFDETLIMSDEESPPPRANKSGSISSCDSNTSGTGSMLEPMEPIKQRERTTCATVKQARRKSNLRPLELPVGGWKSARPAAVSLAANDTDSSSTSSAGSSKAAKPSSLTSGQQAQKRQQVHSPASSSTSGASLSSRLMLIADQDEAEAELEELLDQDEELACSSGTDNSLEESPANEVSRQRRKSSGLLNAIS